MEDKHVSDNSAHGCDGERDHESMKSAIEPEPKSDGDQCQGARYLQAACPGQLGCCVVDADESSEAPSVR